MTLTSGLKIALAASLATAALIRPLPAQSPAASGAAPAEPAQFLQKYIGLSAGEIETARRGRVVTKVLPTKTNEEVAIFGIVAVDASRAEVVARVRDVQRFLRTPQRSAFGLFSTPASETDLRTFVADQSDLDAIRDCRLGDCDVKMPLPRIGAFRDSVDWSSPTAARAKVEALVRRISADYVNRYRAGGTAAMVEYGDQKTVRRASDVFTSLLAESPYLFDYVAPFHDYLANYPARTLPDVTDVVYWANDRMDSMRPVFSINHLSIYSPPAVPLTLVSNKQLYASHYFLGTFTLTTVLDRVDAPAGVYYVVVERFRFDNLPSGGLFNIRRRVIGRMNDALKAELTQRKAELERGR